MQHICPPSGQMSLKSLMNNDDCITDCGEFSIWDFSGYDTFHGIYDHFVGNTDCVHCVVIRCSADTVCILSSTSHIIDIIIIKHPSLF